MKAPETIFFKWTDEGNAEFSFGSGKRMRKILYFQAKGPTEKDRTVMFMRVHDFKKEGETANLFRPGPPNKIRSPKLTASERYKKRKRTLHNISGERCGEDAACEICSMKNRCDRYNSKDTIRWSVRGGHLPVRHIPGETYIINLDKIKDITTTCYNCKGCRYRNYVHPCVVFENGTRKKYLCIKSWVAADNRTPRGPDQCIEIDEKGKIIQIYKYQNENTK